MKTQFLFDCAFPIRVILDQCDFGRSYFLTIQILCFKIKLPLSFAKENNFPEPRRYK